MCDHVGACPCKHEKIPVKRSYLLLEATLITGLGSGSGRPLQSTGVPTYCPQKQQFTPARLTSLQLSSLAEQSTLGIYSASWQHFIPLRTCGRLSIKKDITNTQRNLGVSWQSLTPQLTVSAPKGSSGAKLTQQHTAWQGVCCIPLFNNTSK